jgi:hypothetical protein
MEYNKIDKICFRMINKVFYIYFNDFLELILKLIFCNRQSIRCILDQIMVSCKAFDILVLSALSPPQK